MNDINKPKLIFIEGSAGVGKSSVTNYLREHMLSTSLVRLSGIKTKESNGASLSFVYHLSVLSMLKECQLSEMNWVFDRSFISDRVYAKLGYKEYDFNLEFNALTQVLYDLTKYYDIHVIVLTANETTYENRLKRDKAEYQKFSVQSSLDQQKTYVELVNSIETPINKTIIDTSEADIQTIGKSIIDLVYKD